MDPTFTAHNIRLDDGTFTKPDVPLLDSSTYWVSPKNLLESHFPGDKSSLRLVDLGCLEGGFSVLFARMGFQVLGLEVRESNFAACRYVKARTKLPNLEFVQDNAWNIAKYGTFDVVFCAGLFYHVDRPSRFLELLSSVTKSLLILETHFAPGEESESSRFGLSRFFKRRSVAKPATSIETFRLLPLSEHEGLKGRWYCEFSDENDDQNREGSRWASWGNLRSFWVQREFLLQLIQDVGFDVVMEQFDRYAPDIRGSMLGGDYWARSRSTFVGIKTASKNAT